MNDTVEIETWVSVQADRMKDEGDGSPRIRFSIPVHMDLQKFMNKSRSNILCIYRIRPGFYWSQMGQSASIRVSGYVEDGPKGGQVFHCKSVEILEGKPRATKDKETKRMVRRMEKAAGVPDAGVQPTKKQKTRIAPTPPPPSGQLKIF